MHIQNGTFLCILVCLWGLKIIFNKLLNKKRGWNVCNTQCTTHPQSQTSLSTCGFVCLPQLSPQRFYAARAKSRPSPLQIAAPPLNPLPSRQLLQAKLSHSLMSYPLPAVHLSGRTERRAAAVIKQCGGGLGLDGVKCRVFRGERRPLL